MSSNRNIGKYDGINTLARVANARYAQKTAQAVGELGQLAREQNNILERAARQKSADMRAQTRAIKEGDLMKAAEIRKQALVQKQVADREFAAAQAERDRLEKEADIENVKKEKKGILFAVHDDFKKMLLDNTASTLDKYIHLCGAVSKIKDNELTQMITDDLKEKQIVQEMIDEIDNTFESIRNSFTKQDQKDHDQLIEILESDEESLITSYENDIADYNFEDLERRNSLERNFDPIRKEISDYQKKIESRNNEIEKLDKIKNDISKESLVDVCNFLGEETKSLGFYFDKRKEVSDRTLLQMNEDNIVARLINYLTRTIAKK